MEENARGRKNERRKIEKLPEDWKKDRGDKKNMFQRGLGAEPGGNLKENLKNTNVRDKILIKGRMVRVESKKNQITTITKGGP